MPSATIHHRPVWRDALARSWRNPRPSSDDPYTIQATGDLTLRLHAAQALLEKAGYAWS